MIKNTLSKHKKQFAKKDCFILAFEDTGSGRNMEIYYKQLINSNQIRPIMAYTKKESYDNCPDWIENKILYEIPGVDHDPHDCKYAMCKKPSKLHRSYNDWFVDCVSYIRILKFLGNNKPIWILDSIKPEIERFIYGYIVQVFHGELFDIGVSYYDHKESFGRYDLILTQGNKMTDFINKLIPSNLVGNKVKTIGRLLDEELVTYKIDKKALLTKLKLNTKNKTVVYAPSWESRNVWPSKDRHSAKKDLESFCKYCNENNLNLILRPHSILMKHFNVESFYEHLQEKYTNVYFDNTNKYSNYNPNVSLSVSDYLITDLSSIAVDFLTLKKPVIFMYPAKNILKLYVNPPTFETVSKVSYTSRNLEELKQLLLKLKNQPKLLFKDITKQHLENHNIKSPGKRFKEEIENFVKLKNIEIAPNKIVSFLKYIYIHKGMENQKYRLNITLKPNQFEKSN